MRIGEEIKTATGTENTIHEPRKDSTTKMSQQIREAQELVEEAKRIAGFPALLHRFLDTAAEAIIIVDKDGRIVLFNRRASFLFGWLPDEVLGQAIEMLLPVDLKERHEAHRKGFMSEPYTRAMGANLDLKGRHKDGSEFPVMIDLHPETGSDGVYVRAAIRRKSDANESPLTHQSTCPFKES